MDAATRQTPEPPSWRNSDPSARVIGVVALGCLLLLGYRAFSPFYGMQPSETISVKTRIEINRADRIELENVPGIGPALADAIVNHRQIHGAFQSIEQLETVHGIGPKTLKNVRPWIEVNPEAYVRREAVARGQAPESVETLSRKPIMTPSVVPGTTTKLAPGEILDINSATVAELQRLPGIGPKLAERIIEVRSQKLFTDTQDLRRVSGIGVKTVDKLTPFLRFGAKASN